MLCGSDEKGVVHATLTTWIAYRHAHALPTRVRARHPNMKESFNKGEFYKHLMLVWFLYYERCKIKKIRKRYSWFPQYTGFSIFVGVSV